MVLQNVPIESYQSESLPCWQNLALQWHSGARHSLHWSMSGIDALQLLWTMLHPTNCGMDANPMSPISKSGDQLPMCIARRTSIVHSGPTMRSACSLGIQMATRGGSSTTRLQSAPSSLSELILTSTLQFIHPHPLRLLSKPMHLAIQHLALRTLQRTMLWRLLGFCILGGHLILLGSRIQNPTLQLQHLNPSQC